MGRKINHTPNDHRAIIKNLNNPAYHHDNGNRGGQMNPPQHPNSLGRSTGHGRQQDHERQQEVGANTDGASGITVGSSVGETT